MGTCRASGTRPATRSGRRRPPSGLATRLTTAEVAPTAASPFTAARRPRAPAVSASTPAVATHSLEWSAAPRVVRSRDPGLGCWWPRSLGQPRGRAPRAARSGRAARRECLLPSAADATHALRFLRRAMTDARMSIPGRVAYTAGSIKVLVDAGVVRPIRPDRLLLVLQTLARWGAAPRRARSRWPLATPTTPRSSTSWARSPTQSCTRAPTRWRTRCRTGDRRG